MTGASRLSVTTVCVLVFCCSLPAMAQRDAFLREIPRPAKDSTICFCLYTVNDSILKLTAQLYPLDEADARTVRLEVKDGDGWKLVASADVVTPGWTATFRVTGWDMTKERAYRARHGEACIYEGIIRRSPVDSERITVAAFSCDSIYPVHGGEGDRADIIANVKRLKPDLLYFAGDQVYSHNYHLANWLIFGRNYGEIIRQYPTITIPDDHDVGNPNLWGAGGRKATEPGATDGGYLKPAEYVKEVERAQTSHLPDPFDPTPVQQGIGAYYTSLDWGGISFAILEDRKFRSGPSGLVPKYGPRIDLVPAPDYDRAALDPPGAELLGERQTRFLRQWAAHWRGAEMKCVLSQTLFASMQTHANTRSERNHADLDSGGWPHAARDAALKEIRKAFAVHVTGDQHLASVLRYGVEAFNSAGYAFCTPAVTNLWRRWWEPDEPGGNRRPGSSRHTGEYVDGFGNLMTVMAVANPPAETTEDKLTSRATGWGVIVFDKQKRAITFSCWPRRVDITDPKSKQYPGWPLTCRQQDNYGREAVAYLPTINVRAMDDPIVQIVEETSGEIVYTLRIKGTEFRPKVFQEGTYTIIVGDQGRRQKTLAKVRALPPDVRGVLDIEL